MIKLLQWFFVSVVLVALTACGGGGPDGGPDGGVHTWGQTLHGYEIELTATSVIADDSEVIEPGYKVTYKFDQGDSVVKHDPQQGTDDTSTEYEYRGDNGNLRAIMIKYNSPDFESLLLTVTSANGGTFEYLGQFSAFGVIKLKGTFVILSGGTGGTGGSTDLEGSQWAVTETGITENCGEGLNTIDYSITISSYSDGKVTVKTTAGTFTGTYSGSNISYSGSFSEDGGTTTTSPELTVSDDYTSLSGTTSWTWDDGAGSSCSGTSSISATRK